MQRFNVFAIARALVLGVVALGACGAMAQVDPQPDGVGIYFDPDGNVAHFETTVPLQAVTAYLLATNITAPDGISGFEGAWDQQGGVQPSCSTPCNCAGWICHPFFACGCGDGGDPLPWSPAITLVTITSRVPTPDTEVRYFLGTAPSPSIPGFLAYACGDDLWDIRPLYVSSGSYDLPVATINCAPPVPAAPPTWGTVKSLFR